MIKHLLISHLVEFVKFRLLRSLSTQIIYSVSNTKEQFSFLSDEPAFISDVLDNFKIYSDFITEDEEKELMTDVEPKFKRLRYQFDHWDDAIHGFRETETVKWNPTNSSIMKRMSDSVFAGGDQLPHTHILDLAEDGFIKPHVDSVRYCGDTITGLSLLSDSVMRLVHTKNSNRIVDILLPRLSLYVMSNSVRYNYTHEILDNKVSYFNGSKVHKRRRVSIVCRSPPVKKQD